MHCVMSGVCVPVWKCSHEVDLSKKVVLQFWSRHSFSSAILFCRTGIVDVSINIAFNYDIVACVSFPNHR